MTNNEKAPVMAVSILDQQKASLYGIASVLVGEENIPNRKQMKRNVKTLRKHLIKSLGAESAKELMMQNKGAIEMTFVGIRKFPNYDATERRALIKIVIEDLLPSYLIGVEKVLGVQS